MVLLVAYAFYYKNVFSIVIYHHMPRERRCLRHPGAQQSHLPAEFLSRLIGDTDTVAWLRASRCPETRPHRASQAPIACTASLQPTTPSRATNSKALLVLSGRGAAVALVALHQDHYPSHLGGAAPLLGPTHPQSHIALGVYKVLHGQKAQIRGTEASATRRGNSTLLRHRLAPVPTDLLRESKRTCAIIMIHQ